MTILMITQSWREYSPWCGQLGEDSGGRPSLRSPGATLSTTPTPFVHVKVVCDLQKLVHLHDPAVRITLNGDNHGLLKVNTCSLPHLWVSLNFEAQGWSSKVPPLPDDPI